MDIDQPTYTQVNRAYRVRRAYTEADKSKFRKEGRCFRCDKQGHMARECPTKKQQPFKPQKTTFKKKPPTGQYKRPFRPTRSMPMGYVPQARTASIEEIEEEEEEEDDEEEDEEIYEEEMDSVPSLAAGTAKLNEGQREVWLDEMRQLGINF
jgi:hypothetical protein